MFIIVFHRLFLVYDFYLLDAVKYETCNYLLCCLLIAPSRHQHWRMGTTNMVIDWISIPPKVGIAIGTMISAPFPVEVSTGSSAISVVAVVITAGRTRLRPAWTTASRISSRVWGSLSKKVSWI